MADITPTQVLGPYPSLPVAVDSLDVPLSDISSGKTIRYSKPLILIFYNEGSATSLFITSTASSHNKRTGDIGYSIESGDMACFLINNSDGWADGSGEITVSSNSAQLKLGVIEI